MVTVERSPADAVTAGAIADLINHAFAVEAFFVDGDRTTETQILSLLGGPDKAFFLVRDAGRVVGCVLAERIDEMRGYIGLLAVAADKQGTGIGHRLLTSAEAHLRALGCQSAEITVVDLMTDLFPYYEARHYRRTGAIVPFPRRAKQPCELVVMAKLL